MNTIRAIVMTCDRFRTLTDHMIFKYQQLWPDHPFRFRVPYQELGPTIETENVEYKKAPTDIKATVLTLLNDLDDEELVYWCIDDKYPIRIDVPRIDGIFRWLIQENSSMISGILFCRCRRMWDDRFLTGQAIVDDMKNVYLEKRGYAQIWIHQFLRVKVLRHLFESFPDIIPVPRSMDEFKKRCKKPPSHRMFVSRENCAVFGESTSHGILTRNCHQSISENSLALPVWFSETTADEIIMGTLDDGRQPMGEDRM